MPTAKQTENNTHATRFSAARGGHYINGTLNNEATYGYWWGSTAYNGALRFRLYYNSSTLYADNGGQRHTGMYIRCVSEEKDVSDLTYMQDMTPSVAANTAASLHHPSRTLCHSECIKSLIL